ncbi:Glutaredoxin family protein, partial [Thalictrum thalictroides]
EEENEEELEEYLSKELKKYSSMDLEVFTSGFSQLIRANGLEEEYIGIFPDGIKVAIEKEEESELLLKLYEEKCPPGGENSVIIYTTTIDQRMKRSFKESNDVRAILRTHQIVMIERDVYGDVDYEEEIIDVMGKMQIIPILFVKGRFIGEADEVKRLEGKVYSLWTERNAPRFRSICTPKEALSANCLMEVREFLQARIKEPQDIVRNRVLLENIHLHMSYKPVKVNGSLLELASIWLILMEHSVILKQGIVYLLGITMGEFG